MSEVKTTTTQQETIKSRDELLKFFDMPNAVDMPEFKGTIEFTKTELESLRQQLGGVDQTRMIAEIRKAIDIKKAWGTFEVREHAVLETTWFRLDQLQRGVWPSKQVSKNFAEWLKWQQFEPNKLVKTKEEPKLLESPWEWAKEHPVKGVLIWAGTLFAWYKLVSGIMGMFSSDKSGSAGKEWLMGWVAHNVFRLDKDGIAYKFLNDYWMIAGLAWAWAYFGWDYLKTWFDWVREKMWWETKTEKQARGDAQEKLKIEGVTINSETLKKIGWMKLWDVLSGWKIADILSYLSGNNNILQRAQGLITGVDLSKLTEQERKEFASILTFLKKEQEEWKMPEIQENSTLRDWYLYMSNPEEAAKLPSDRKIIKKWSTETKTPREQPYVGASPTAVLISRMYQAYHGSYKPWSEMGQDGQRVIAGRLKVWADKLAIWKSEFDIAKNELPQIGRRIQELNVKLKTTPGDADILAELTLLQSKEGALLWGKIAYQGFVESMRSEANIASRLNSLEWHLFDRTAYLEAQLTHWHKIQSGDVLAYEKSMRDFNAIVADNESAIKNLQSQLKNATTDAEKAAIVAKITAREAIVQRSFEKTVPLMEEYSKTCAKLASKDGWFMEKKWLSAWRQESTQMEHLTMKNKKIFRIGKINGKFALIWLGLVGFSGITGKEWERWKTMWATGKRMLAGMVPFYGTYLDGKDTWNSIKTWDGWGIAANAACCVTSAVSDVLLVVSCLPPYAQDVATIPAAVAVKSAGSWIVRTVSRMAGRTIVKGAEVAAVKGAEKALITGGEKAVIKWGEVIATKLWQEALVESEKAVTEVAVEAWKKWLLQQYLIRAWKVTWMTALALGAGQIISCFMTGPDGKPQKAEINSDEAKQMQYLEWQE